MADEKDVKLGDTGDQTGDVASKDQDKDKIPETIPYSRFQEVNTKMRDFEKQVKELSEEAEIYRDMQKDPVFQGFVERLNKGEGFSFNPETSEFGVVSAESPTGDEIPFTPEQQAYLSKKLGVEVGKVEKKLETKTQEDWNREADRELSDMSKDTETFPFLEEVREDMIKLIQDGHASSLRGAYKLASYERHLEKAKEDVRTEYKTKGIANIGESGTQGPVTDTGKRYKRPSEAAAEALEGK